MQQSKESKKVKPLPRGKNLGKTLTPFANFRATVSQKFNAVDTLLTHVNNTLSSFSVAFTAIDKVLEHMSERINNHVNILRQLIAIAYLLNQKGIITNEEVNNYIQSIEEKDAGVSNQSDERPKSEDDYRIIDSELPIDSGARVSSGCESGTDANTECQIRYPTACDLVSKE